MIKLAILTAALVTGLVATGARASSPPSLAATDPVAYTCPRYQVACPSLYNRCVYIPQCPDYQ